ncbi:hypothetical protein [Amphibacillus indicireducens]|uniref:Uncharacterized protein n=1 Tax=Amphibacillus indicireducens TaxID=1076330 RepID=A0ABP7VNP1_9BACI
MLRTIYQKLIIIGFTERFILICLLIISFFILFYLIRWAVYYLLKKRLFNLLVYLITFLIIFLLTKDRLKQLSLLDSSSYLYVLSLFSGYLMIQLLSKKIIQKSR